jgi:hypothetical protein
VTQTIPMLALMSLTGAPGDISARIVGLDDCDTRQCIKVRVTADSESGTQARFELAGDTLLPVRVADALGPRAAEGYYAIVEAIGVGLRRGRKAWRAPLKRALDSLEAAGVVRCHERLPEVQLEPEIERRLAAIAGRYFRATGRRLVVTSGTRGPESQAEAMYIKLRLGVNLLRQYRDRASVLEIRDAWRQTKRAGGGREECIAAMATAIARQMSEERYISRHLRSGAVDVRSRNMTRKDKAALLRSAREEPGVRIMEEGRPPHFHLSFL